MNDDDNGSICHVSAVGHSIRICTDMERIGPSKAVVGVKVYNVYAQRKVP